MTREDLFLAIGEVEEERLMKTELSAAGKPRSRHLRNLLIAAVIVSTLALTAIGAGYFLYDSPQTMISAIFGDNTGFDRGEYTEIPDPERPGSLLAVQPAYDREEADTRVVQEDIAPYVTPVGQSISWQDMVLTVDAFVYDSATQCGVVTYILENGPQWDLQFNGQVSYYGMKDPVYFSHYGYSYIIQEKSDEDTLAAAYYFRYNPPEEEEFFAALQMGLSAEERQQMYADAGQRVRDTYSPPEMTAAVKEKLGQEDFDLWVRDSGMTAEELAFQYLRDSLIVEWTEGYEDRSREKICFDCSESRELKHITLAEGGITLSPISMALDVTCLPQLFEEGERVHPSGIRRIVLRFSDGTEFLLEDDTNSNTLFKVIHSADGLSNENYTILTIMFNRVVDLDTLSAVIINGQEFPA